MYQDDPGSGPIDWLRENARLLTLAAVAGALALGFVLWRNRPVVVPNLALKDGAGAAVTFSDLRQGRPRLVLVFLLKGDPLSTYSLQALKDLYPARSGSMAFVGLYVGTQADADRFQKETEAPFPFHGLLDAADPFAVQDLLKKVGVNTMVTTGVYGGTVVVVDPANKVLLRLEKDECRDLGARLARI